MAKVNICNIEVLNSPSQFNDPFKFRVTFECHEPLEEDLEWKLVYVSSAYNESLDQVLDSILVGPVPVGRHQFEFEADAPDPKKIPKEDIVGVTVVLIQALYRDKEFIRVGYYVNNEYKKEELRNEPPTEPILDELERSIMSSDPRVTRFPIDWGDGLLDGCPEPEQNETDEAAAAPDGDGKLGSAAFALGKEVENGEEDEEDIEEEDDEDDVEVKSEDLAEDDGEEDLQGQSGDEDESDSEDADEGEAAGNGSEVKRQKLVETTDENSKPNGIGNSNNNNNSSLSNGGKTSVATASVTNANSNSAPLQEVQQ